MERETDCLSHRITMFFLIWATLLFPVRGINSGKGGSVEGKTVCKDGFCITLNEAEITAEAGLCVVIPCSFNTSSRFTTQNMVWFKCEASKRCVESDIISVQSGFKGRVSLLEPDVRQKNCSIIINDVTESDSGSYQFRVNGHNQNNKANGFTFPLRPTVSVKGLTQKPTVMIPPLAEGQQTTLTCTAPGLCSGSDPEITWMWRGAGENDSHITGNITAFKTENLTAVTQRHSSTLTFNASAEHHNTNVTCKVSFTNSITTEETVTLNVTYKPVITGMTSVKVGDTLNLSCSVESFRPSLITWTKLGSNKNLQKETSIILHNDTGTATLFIRNVTTEHSGLYVCTATHQIPTLTVRAEVTVKLLPKIVHTRCVVQSEVLTCVCVSEAFPLPSIKWPLLENHSEYSIVTTVTKHSVNSTVTLTVKDHSSTDVACVSSNENGEATENITIIKNEFKQDDLLEKVLLTVQQPQVIIAFFIGILLSATICCLARKCCRKKLKNPENVAETLEMATAQVVPLMDAGQSAESDQTHNQEATDEGTEAAGQSAPDGDVVPKEVEYSDIDFSRCNRTREEDAQQTTETEYAEIKKEEREDREDDGGEDGEMLEGNEVEVVMTGEDETKQCLSTEKEGGEDTAVYSNVSEIMAEI